MLLFVCCLLECAFFVGVFVGVIRVGCLLVILVCFTCWCCFCVIVVCLVMLVIVGDFGLCFVCWVTVCDCLISCFGMFGV